MTIYNARRTVWVAVVAVAASACSDGGFLLGPDRGPVEVDAAVICDPDMTPPVLSISATPNTLWPPNHRFVTVTLTIAASDECSAVSVSAPVVSSNEPVNGIGDGNTEPDWIVTGPTTVQLRSERAGPGSGRVYTIGVTATNAIGLVTSASTVVIVPHDQGQGSDVARDQAPRGPFQRFLGPRFWWRRSSR